MFGFDSLQELCVALHHSPNCTCESIGIVGQSDFCKIKQESRNVDHENHNSLLLPVLITIVAILALIGNSAVVWIKGRKNANKSRHTYLIILLAVCDMFFAVFVLVYYVPAFYTTHWVYGLIGCKVISCAATLGAWVSIGVILIIAVERFFGIVFPLRRDMTNRRMIIFLVANVLLAIGLVIPRMIHLQIHPERLLCYENWMDQDETYAKVYDWSMFILYSAAPIIVISTLYLWIFRSFSRSLVRYKQDHSQYMERVKAKRMRSNKRSMVLLVAVLIAFVLCTFPNKIRWLILSVVSTSSSSFKKEMENPYFHTVTEVMYSIHLAINPLIYASADYQFRRTLKKSFLSLFGKSRVTASPARTQTFQLN